MLYCNLNLKGNAMLYEKIEATKSLSKESYKQLIAEVIGDSKPLIEDVVCLFVISAINKDKFVYDKIKLLIEQSDHFDDYEIKFYYFMSIGLFNYHMANYSGTLSAYLNLIDVAYKSEDSLLITEGNRLIGIVYRKTGDFEQAKYYIEKSIRTLKDVDFILVKARVYMSYGVILSDMNTHTHSIRAFETSLAYFKRLDNYKSLINYRILLLNLYESYEAIGKDEEAVEYYMMAKDVKFDSNEIMFNEKFLYSNSRVLKKQGKYLEALEILEGILDRQRIVNVPTSDNKSGIQLHLDQIDLLKSRNDTLVKKLTELYETINPVHTNKNHLQLENQLNQALANDEIKPYFQLVWDVKAKRYCGAEALIRWIKDDVVVPPGQFIPDVEDTSMIIKLSEKVIKDAFILCREAIDLGHSDFVVSVNIAPYQLYNHNISSFIKGEMILNNIESKNIEIEITERSFLEQNPKILQELYKLRDLGIKIALDDFGKGYSSLACINEFPIDVIKIDRSLIKSITEDEKSYKLLDGIIGMVKALDLAIVAEGVETIDQVRILEELQCDIIQGYYYDQPSKCCNMLKKLDQNQ